jgi:hypothetical protein
MDTVDNGRAGELVIPGMHAGPCGIGAGPSLRAAFRWSRSGPRPETAAGADATLDGRACRVRSIERSKVSAGFYVAELEPVDG